MKGQYVDVFLSLISSTKDCCGIFDEDDVLIFCNPSFQENMCVQEEDIGVVNFSDIIRNQFHQKKGIKIDSNNLEEFVEYVKKVRRSIQYRSFEADYIDGRWFSVSEYTSDDGYLIMTLQDMTKSKVNTNQLNSELMQYKNMAMIDELTSINNRRGLITQINDELKMCTRPDTEVAFLIIDFDFFKNINDKYGHQKGDDVLMHVVQLIKENLSESDVFGRVGGEEFVVFMKETNKDRAFDFGVEMKNLVKDNPYEIDGQLIPITISVGVSVHTSSTDFEKFYETADRALYTSKRNGRDQVTLFEEG
ncbi:sensor domain-containing diguanylate cyclase [Marinomonas atlantica]|uniref:sensor domain-containing diguanylate cyclase n=1 Tax=Marinomonas atlantica TaxID=1806668 RepID=UPI000836233F|nr:sensor domain-containing diguanylate cyclase [Marinomonas atlantica]MCO4785197.1 diguanylate cyclase [Marinomonas atlantica]